MINSKEKEGFKMTYSREKKTTYNKGDLNKMLDEKLKKYGYTAERKFKRYADDTLGNRHPLDIEMISGKKIDEVISDTIKNLFKEKDKQIEDLNRRVQDLEDIINKREEKKYI
jgi:polyhydroxyalkanoate synthesis regulator phasin